MSATKTIKKIMLDKDITVKFLAEKLNITPQVLSNKLYRDTFSYNDYVAIANILGCDVKTISKNGTVYDNECDIETLKKKKENQKKAKKGDKKGENTKEAE